MGWAICLAALGREFLNRGTIFLLKTVLTYAPLLPHKAEYGSAGVNRRVRDVVRGQNVVVWFLSLWYQTGVGEESNRESALVRVRLSGIAANLLVHFPRALTGVEDPDGPVVVERVAGA